MVFEFNFAAMTLAPPGATNIASNATSAELSTLIWIDYRPVGVAGSYAPLFRTILPGDVLHIADKTNSAQYAEFTCSDLITDFPAETYVQVPVSFVRATASAQTGQNVFLFLLRSAY